MAASLPLIGGFFQKDEISKFYTMKKVLGKGGFATVRLAKNKVTKKRVAIKCISKSGKTNVKLMEQEVEVLNHVSHPNCVTVHEIFDSPDTLYLVMDLCSGGELLKYISDRDRFSEQEAARIVKEILEGIQYLHSVGIVHRDIKPENILLEKPGPDSRVKITDFGLSKLVQGKHQFLFSRCGTPAYVAPELIKGEAYGPKVDLWAIGVLTYLLICGYPPFWGNTIEELFDRIVDANFAFHADFWSHSSVESRHFIEQLICVDVSKRYDAALALQHPWISSTNPKTTTLRSMAPLKAYTERRAATIGSVGPSSSTPAGGPGDSSAVFSSDDDSFPSGFDLFAHFDPWKYFTDATAETRLGAGRSLESTAGSEPASSSGPNRSALFALNFAELPDADFERIEAKYPLWPPYEVALKGGRLTGNYDISVITSELARDSTQKQRAHDLGFIRPFLLLVSMSPYSRAAVAATLQVPIVDKIWYGNPHIEAWEILGAEKIGLIDRSSKFKDRAFADFLGGICWFDSVFRVSEKVFSHRKDPEDLKEKYSDYKEFIESVGRPTIQEACRNPDKAQMCEDLEAEFFLDLVHKVFRFRQTLGTGLTSLPMVFESIEQMRTSSPAGERMLVNFDVAGFSPDEKHAVLCKSFGNYFFGQRYLISTDTATGNRESNLAFWNKEKEATLTSVLRREMGYAHLLPLIASVCLQRIFLAAVGIPINTFYPDPHKIL